ncbi:type IV secretory system conjugative DNA transfer family protein, partial [Pseudonocardia sp. Ae406_Ps2]
FQDSTLSELCSPGPGEEFDAQRFIGLGGTLYLIAGQREDGAIAPVLTALAEEWIDAARSMALRYPSERLDPPATVVLDELPSATPVPDLPATLADSAGRGVLIHWAAQSKAQLDNTFGRDRATMLLDNSALMAVWGGLKDGSTLQRTGRHCSGCRPSWATTSATAFSPRPDSSGLTEARLAAGRPSLLSGRRRCEQSSGERRLSFSDTCEQL